MLPGEVKLGGKTFQVVNYDVITVLNEHYIMKLMRATGLDSVMPREDEPDESYLIRLQAKLVDTLELPALLAGYLLPAGTTEADFRLAGADETRRFIEGLTSPLDKAEIHRLGYMVVMDFFRAGLASLRLSQSYFGQPTTTPDPAQAKSQPPNAAH